MRIGIDLDDVLADFVPAFLAYYNRRHGTTFSKGDVWSYHFWEVFGVSKDETLRRVFAFLDSPEADHMRPIDGSREGIAALAEDHELHIVTGRQDRIAEMTFRWLSWRFGDPFEDIHFANHYSGSGPNLSKGVICDRLGLDVLVDDAPTNALESAAPGRKVLLLDAPWNSAIRETDSIMRVRSWGNIVLTIGSLCTERQEI